MVFVILAIVGGLIEAFLSFVLDGSSWSWGQRFLFVGMGWAVLHVWYWFLDKLLERLMYARHGAFYGVQRHLTSLGSEAGQDFGGEETIRQMMAEDPIIGAVKLCHFVLGWPIAIGLGLWVAL